MDFTVKSYQELLNALLSQGFSFITFADYSANRNRNASPPNGIINPQSAIRNFTLSDGGRAAVVERSRDQSRPAEVPKFVILRHDVEAKYGNALKMARVQHQLGIRGTYFFRIYPHRGNEAVIREIAALGHEIGYHYDDLSECKGDYEKAIQRFQKNLAYLRQFGPVTSATMEGAPLSKFDNRDLWGKAMGEAEVEVKVKPAWLTNQSDRSNSFSQSDRAEGVTANLQHDFTTQPQSELFSSSQPQPQPEPSPSAQPFSSPRAGYVHYTDFGILTEPYFDMDFSEIFYLTDTGRRWDGWKVSLRDKIPGHQERWIKDGLVFHGTKDIIMAAQQDRLPQKMMITVHPQRWNDALVPWVKELVLQKAKNVVKGLMVK